MEQLSVNLLQAVHMKCYLPPHPFFIFPDGVDFNSSTPDTLVFPPNSNPHDTQCIAINLLNDTLLEVAENFIVELNTNDPAVTITGDANLAIITIVDIPHPLGK